MADTELCFLDGGELAALIRQRAVSPVKIVEAWLTRIDQFNDGVRAYLCVSGNQALAAMRAAERSKSPRAMPSPSPPRSAQ